MSEIIIALDAMGGDHGPQVVVPAALLALERHLDLHLILVGDEAALIPLLPKKIPDRISLQHATQIVAMDESPSLALRTKKDSSMRVAINMVKEKKAHACVSAGNTGALMATARFVLKTIPGIDRPAIMSDLPTTAGKTRMLDLGANVDSNAENLVQFAVMGSVLVSALDGIERPRVGLLNIGTEEIKGNDQVKHTAYLLSELKPLNYIGYVEGDDIFTGTADVVVCDGFVGNVALKTIEGVAHLIKFFMKEAFQATWYGRLAAFLALPVLNRLKKRMDPARYNGASLLGLQGSVVKSHGGASIEAYTYAISQAVNEAKHDVPRLIHDRVVSILNEGDYQ